MEFVTGLEIRQVLADLSSFVAPKGLDDDGNSRFACDMELELAGRLFEDSKGSGFRSFTVEDRADGAADFFGSYGALFFIGILLSAVFLAAAVLIIYYKQISEGYDDRGRFQILLKVGMTEKETKATIRRQIVIVFFLPVITAVIHMTVAYTVTKKLLALLMLSNNKLFLLCTALTIVAFTLLYLLIYRLTARTYYRIVR